MEIPSSAEFIEGFTAFQRYEKRDAMYRIATYLIEHFWGKPYDMADSLGVLLLTWNSAFYRYGLFDFEKLEECLSKNQNLLDRYREKDILSHSLADEQWINHLFHQFLIALQISEGKKAGTKSPVGVSKALHLLAPGFFPLWDNKIARAYGCNYDFKPKEKYLKFFIKTKHVAEELNHCVDTRKIDKTLVKLIDEYNYSKFTKSWI